MYAELAAIPFENACTFAPASFPLIHAILAMDMRTPEPPALFSDAHHGTRIVAIGCANYVRSYIRESVQKSLRRCALGLNAEKL
jgi:hypothetical protein